MLRHRADAKTDLPHEMRGNPMLRRSIVLTGIVVAAIVALTVPAFAKVGVTGVEIPPDTTAGQPFEVSFTMEDHDGGLSEDSQMTVLAQHIATGETQEFEATPTGDKFHWSARLTLPVDGSWVITVEERTLGFRQELRSISVAANATAGITPAELERAIDEATGSLNQQMSAMTLEIDQLQKQLGALAADRDVLQKQVAQLQSSPPAAESGTSWWLAAIAAAAAAIGVASAVVLRRGVFPRPTRDAAVPVSASGD
jgi:hypothetical protein